MLKSGDKLQFTRTISTPAIIKMTNELILHSGRKHDLEINKKWHDKARELSYQEGDILELVEPTGQAPFGYQSHLCNWTVKCKHFSPPQKESVWSAIWSMVDDGTLRKI